MWVFSGSPEVLKKKSKVGKPILLCQDILSLWDGEGEVTWSDGGKNVYKNPTVSTLIVYDPDTEVTYT